MTKLVHLWPDPYAYLEGVAAIECDVDAERAAYLVATGAFHRQPPASAEPSDAPASPEPETGKE
jgi:hypothetical protein